MSRWSLFLLARSVAIVAAVVVSTEVRAQSALTPYPTTGAAFESRLPTSAEDPPFAQLAANDWGQAASTTPVYLDTDVYAGAPPGTGPLLADGANVPYYHWQLLPDGLIYRSYLAGPREPRISTVLFEEEDGRFLWDPIVGGRAGLLRFGDNNPLNPQGLQVDVEGAAVLRLNLDANRDVESSDFRFGFPITYGVDQWQFKFGYYHLSSHLGDEFIARTPGAMRINYVRDAIILGVSYNLVPSVRLYAETAYAFYTSGGAEPWEFQFGFEYAQPGPTGFHGTPFFAANAHLHEEVNYSGDLTVQAGWLWRSYSGRTFRTGFHYMNGKSTQYQFLTDSEQQVGWGLWYDF